MHNVVIVSMNKDSAITVASKIADKMSFNYIDADKILEDHLIKTLDFPLTVSDDLMTSIETSLQQNLKNASECVISIGDDLFLSNKFYENLKKSLKILVKIDETSEIDKEIQKLLEKNCDVIINEKDIDFDKLIKLME